MRILTDENISPVIVAALEAAGHDVVAVATMMPGASDEAVIARAASDGRVLVTEDKDFGELAFKHDYRSAEIVGLALPGRRTAQKAAHLREVLSNNEGRILGRAVVIEPVAGFARGSIAVRAKSTPTPLRLQNDLLTIMRA